MNVFGQFASQSGLRRWLESCPERYHHNHTNGVPLQARSGSSACSSSLVTPASSPKSHGSPCAFEANFETANLQCVRLIEFNSTHKFASYELWLEPDAGSENGLWFHFRCVGPCGWRVLFTLRNFRPPRKLEKAPFVQGAAPSVGKRMDNGQMVYHQQHLCTDIRLEVSKDKRTCDLCWVYEFSQAPEETVYFAFAPPYGYSRLCNYLTKASTSQYLRVSTLTTSECGLMVPLVLLGTDPSDNDESTESSDGSGGDRQNPRSGHCQSDYFELEKTKIFIIARQHSGEPNGSFAMEGLLNFLISDHSPAVALREKCDFYIVPMVNVDGVVYGTTRGLPISGLDPNRLWECQATKSVESYAGSAESRSCQAVVATKRKLMQQLQRRGGVSLFLDLHAHSEKMGTFLYGRALSRGDLPMTGLFPRFCAMATKDVSFDECRLNGPSGNAHQKAARCVAAELGVSHSFTIEISSFGGMTDSIFTPGRVLTIGEAIGRATSSFLCLNRRIQTLRARRQNPSPHRDEPWLTFEALDVPFETVVEDVVERCQGKKYRRRRRTARKQPKRERPATTASRTLHASSPRTSIIDSPRKSRYTAFESRLSLNTPHLPPLRTPRQTE